MKKFLLGCALFLLAGAASAWQETSIPLATRVASTVTTGDMFARDAGNGARDLGLIVNAVVTGATGAANTLTFTIQGKTPQGTYYDVLSSTPVTVTTTAVPVLKLRPGITATAGVSASEPLPPVFRVRSSLTGTGSATYSIGISRTQ